MRAAWSASCSRSTAPRRSARSARPLAELPALVAPDSFKGTFSAAEVAAAIARGLRSAGRAAEELPVADGGEGTLAALMATLPGKLEHASVSGPLGGRWRRPSA